ncbi:hypothetical protein PanWU01x14_113180, partial [Parasponia andersonii]
TIGRYSCLPTLDHVHEQPSGHSSSIGS